MPTTALSHDQNRLKVCAVCYCRSGRKATREVNTEQESLIQELVFDEYNKSDPKYPAGLCLTCLFTLSDHSHGHSLQDKTKEPRKLLLPDPDTYETELKRFTRTSSDSPCSCRICEIGRLGALEWRRFVAKCKKEKSTSSTCQKFDRLCKDCLAPIYRGSNHTEGNCRSKRQSLENISQAVLDSNSSMDIVTSHFLRSKAAETGSTSFQVRSDTGGHPLSVSVGRSGDPPLPSISLDQAKTIQNEANLSDRQVYKVFKNLRLQLGRKIVDPSLRDRLIKDKQQLDSFFSVGNIEFSDNEGKSIARPFVYCSDIVGFVHELAKQRNLNMGDLVVKVGLDGGKGHLKMILSMYDPSGVLGNTGDVSRVTREQGIGSGEDYSLLGRKKVIILAIAPNTPENYTNLQIFYDMVGINQLAYKQTGDLKAFNILLGLMACSSLSGCCYCEAKRSSSEWKEGGGKLRTAGNMGENVNNFQQLGGGDKNKAKDVSSNCVSKALLFDENDELDTLVLLKCPPPALHLKLSLNHLLTELSKAWPPILDWLASKHIVLEPYNGGQTLEGNDCNKVLKNLESLEEVIPATFSSFLETLKAFRDVVDSCFGFLLDPYYKQVLSRFRSQFKRLQEEFNVSTTNKIHIICFHVEEFCDLVGRGLGEFSEQETENAHSAFDSMFDRYRVKDIKSPVYMQQYFRAVMNLNTNNL